jgi:hypothetical protein
MNKTKFKHEKQNSKKLILAIFPYENDMMSFEKVIIIANRFYVSRKNILSKRIDENTIKIMN